MSHKSFVTLGGNRILFLLISLLTISIGIISYATAYLFPMEEDLIVTARVFDAFPGPLKEDVEKFLRQNGQIVDALLAKNVPDTGETIKPVLTNTGYLITARRILFLGSRVKGQKSRPENPGFEIFALEPDGTTVGRIGVFYNGALFVER